MQVLPLAQVGGFVEQHVAADAAPAGGDDHVPGSFLLLTPGRWIAEAGDLHAGWRRGDDGLGQLAPVEERVIFGDGEALRLAEIAVAVAECGLIGRHLAHAGVEQGRFAIGDDGGAGEAAILVGAAGSGGERDGLAAPADHIGRDGVRPVHVSPDGGVRVVLKEHVVAAAPEDRAAGIVHPAARRLQVVLRAHGICRLSGRLARRQIIGARGVCG